MKDGGRNANTFSHILFEVEIFLPQFSSKLCLACRNVQISLLTYNITANEIRGRPSVGEMLCLKRSSSHLNEIC